MGEFVKQGEETVYRQSDGEITANLTEFKEKMELVHKGSSNYKHLFHLLAVFGLVYLIVIFIFY